MTFTVTPEHFSLFNSHNMYHNEKPEFFVKDKNFVEKFYETDSASEKGNSDTESASEGEDSAANATKSVENFDFNYCDINEAAEKED